MKKIVFLKDEKGAISVFIAIAFVAVLGISALVFDFGNSYITASELQNSADAAVLAGVQNLPMEDESNWDTEILPIVQGYVSENDTHVFTVNPVRNNSNIIVGVEVIASKELNVPLIDIFGGDVLNVQRRAVARIFTLNSATGLVPIGINEDILDAEGFDGSVVLDIDPSEESSVKYGWLFFDKVYEEHSNANSKLVDWMENGFDQSISVGDEIPWTDGSKTATVMAYNDLVGKEVLAPIYEVVSVEDGEDNDDVGVVRITGFVMLKVEPYTPGGTKNKTMRATFIRRVNISETSSGGDDILDYRVGAIRLID